MYLSSMFVSSLREFTEDCDYNHCGINCFIEYLHRKLLTANFLSYDIDSAEKVHLLDLHIKTNMLLLYYYVFNHSKNYKTF